MYINRLIEMIDLIEKLLIPSLEMAIEGDNNRLHMSTYVARQPVIKKQHFCNSACCVAGYAACHPDAKEILNEIHPGFLCNEHYIDKRKLARDIHDLLGNRMLISSIFNDSAYSRKETLELMHNNSMFLPLLKHQHLTSDTDLETAKDYCEKLLGILKENTHVL